MQEAVFACGGDRKSKRIVSRFDKYRNHARQVAPGYSVTAHFLGSIAQQGIELMLASLVDAVSAIFDFESYPQSYSHPKLGALTLRSCAGGYMNLSFFLHSEFPQGFFLPDEKAQRNWP